MWRLVTHNRQKVCGKIVINVLQIAPRFSIIKSCVVVPAALMRAAAAGQMQTAGEPPLLHGINLSKGEYDYDLFAASTEYVPDHQRS